MVDALTRVLVVEDDDHQRRSLVRFLTSQGYSVASEPDAAHGLKTLRRGFSIAIVDLNLPDMHGLELLRRIRVESPATACVVLTGSGAQAAEAARALGASDYFEKPIENLPRFRAAIRQCVQLHGQRLGTAQVMSAQPLEILGDSTAITRVREAAERAALSTAPVLVTGESGVGKEIVAEVIHRIGRGDGPLVRVNCAALPADLFEAELFGVVEGTYTGQRGPRQGLFAAAHGGTILLDEVGTMPLNLQPKLLRVLQSGRYIPLGGRKEEQANARIIAATNADLDSAVDRGAFREDLYFRLDVLRIDVPPLRQRREDVPVLLQHFLRHWALSEGCVEPAVPDAVVAALVGYDWPGNVRELENVARRAVVLSRGSELSLSDFGPRASRADATDVAGGWDRYHRFPLARAKTEMLRDFTRSYVTAALREAGGNVPRAAAAAGVHPSNYWRLMRNLDVKK